MTLFDKYGGLPTVTSVVRSFYKGVLVNPILKPYFLDIAAEKLIHHQIIFISHLLGKPASEKLNSTEVMKRAHTGRKISESAFLEVTEILKSVLVTHQMEEPDIVVVMALVESFKNAIVEFPTVTRTGRPDH